VTIFQDLVKVYDDNQDKIGVFEQDHFQNDFTLLPASHISVNIQVEVTIDDQGNFLTANTLDKQGNTTVIPATIESANRASNPEAHPLQDKVKYVAGDYPDYASNDKKASVYYPKYIDLLKAWSESEYTNSRIKAIYQYQQKKSLIQDLISSSVIELEDGNVSKKDSDLFVRFNVYDENPVPVWQDRQLFKSWTAFYEQFLSKSKAPMIDYLTGNRGPTTKLSERNINPATSGAKLISANDGSNFTYRGMFLDDDFYSVGYLESQKMMHSLKWLIQRQGLKSDSRVFLFWSDENSNDLISDTARSLTSGIPAWRQKQIQLLSEIQSSGDTGKEIAQAYNERLLGMNSDIQYGQPVHIIFLDAATTGRMATVYYNFMDTKLFRSHVEQWAKNCGIVLNGQGKQFVHTPTINQILKSAYQTGRGGQRYETVKKRATSRLLISIINGANVPNDILTTLQARLIKPQGYESLSQWYYDLNNYVAVLNYNQRKGKINMTLNPDNLDRSYLFGRLLALADDAESTALYQQQAANKNVSSRLTTALRFMTNFNERPATTWQRIYQSIVRSYLMKLSGGSQYYYQEQFKEIMDLLNDNGMTDDPLSPLYLSGFASQHVFNHRKNKQTNEEEE